MSQTVSPSVDRIYGLARVARCWNSAGAIECTPITTTNQLEADNSRPALQVGYPYSC